MSHGMSVIIKPYSDLYCHVSFEGAKWYLIRKDAIWPSRQLKRILYIIEYTDNEMVSVDGYYDKELKVLKLDYNKDIYNLYKSVIKSQSLAESGQTFLVDEQKRREAQIVPINVKLVEYKEPIVGETYVIYDATETSREFADDKGGKRTVECINVDYEPVERKADDKTRYRATLWVPDNREVAPSGKLGSHLEAFADYFGEDSESLVKTLEPKEWAGKKVKIIKWSDRARQIEVIR